jgi:hypothetical protein
MSSTSFLVPKSLLNPENTIKPGREDEEMISRLSEEAKYLKKQHELFAQKLKKSEEFCLKLHKIIIFYN